MSNTCLNKMVVLGSREAVEAFARKAEGAANATWMNHATEKSVYDAVHAGATITSALDAANERIRALKLACAPDPYIIPGASKLLELDADDDIASWESFGSESAHEVVHSHLSLHAIVPPPQEILSESYHLLGYNWCLEHWGCKGGVEVEKPEIEELPDGRLRLSYPIFDSPNAAPNAFFRKASGMGDLLIVNAWGEPDTDDFGYQLSRGGEVIEHEVLSKTDLNQFELTDEDGFEYIDLAAFFDMQIHEALVRSDFETAQTPTC